MLFRTTDDIEAIIHAPGTEDWKPELRQVYEAVVSQLDPNRLIGWITQQSLADQAGVSVTTVRKCLRELHSEGLIGRVSVSRQMVLELLNLSALEMPKWSGGYLYTLHIDSPFFAGLRKTGTDE